MVDNIVNQVILLKDSNSRIGLYTRNTTIGAEYTMVEQFIDYYCSKFIRDNKKHNLAVFVEPRIDSGFPDVVFAVYRPSIMDNWSNEREKLDVSDLKLLYSQHDWRCDNFQTRFAGKADTEVVGEINGCQTRCTPQ